MVRIPQIHNFELREPLMDVYGIRPGEELSIPILFTNSGNGDERYEIEFDDNQLPTGWQRTGATSHTIAAFTDSTHTMNVIAPDNASGSEDFTITVVFRDKNNDSYTPIAINIRTSLPTLEITEVFSDSDPLFGTMHTFTVQVENSGLVDAENVVVVAGVRGVVESNGSATKDIRAGESVNFIITVNLTKFDTPDQVWIDFEILTDGQELAEPPEIFPKRFTLKAQAVDDSTATNVIGVILLSILIFVLWYFTRSGSRRPGAPF